MKKFLLSAMLATAAIFLISPAPSLGCIAIPSRPDDSEKEMQLPEQRAFLYRQGAIEHMILSVQYNGATEEFAWVIPTETQAKVDVQGGAPFHELWKITKLQVPPAPEMTRSSVGSAPGSPPPVKVLERKQAGPYDIAVLQASSGGGLYEWLRKNGFGVNQSTRNALDDYVDKGWYFVAARIRPKKLEKATTALHNGTIAPLHISYKASELSYPMRVTAGNPGTSKIELFVVADEPPQHAGLRADTFKLSPQGSKGFKVDGPPNGLTKAGEFPTLRKLIPQGGTLTKYSGTLGTAQRQRDLVFAQMAETTASK